MRTAFLSRTPLLFAVGFFVLGLGAWGLWVQTHLLAAPCLLLALVGLWAGLLDAEEEQHGRPHHVLTAALPLMLGPVLLVTADLVGRSVGGDHFGLAVLGRLALLAALATAALAAFVHFVSRLALGVERTSLSRG